MSRWELSREMIHQSVFQRGDTPLHIAIRGRSRRLAELLLRNPKDGRLLYRPNKAGETPYNIDCSHQKSILTQIFGARKWSLVLLELMDSKQEPLTMVRGSISGFIPRRVSQPLSICVCLCLRPPVPYGV